MPTILIDLMRARLANALSTALILLGISVPVLGAGPAEEPALPRVEAHHQQFLSRLARRTMRDAFLRDRLYEPSYVPGELADQEAEVVIRFRQDGFLLAETVSARVPLAAATRDAVSAAYQMLDRQHDITLDLLNDLLVEIELVGLPQALPQVPDWTRPRAVDPYIEPGVHGMLLAGPSGTYRFCPTEVFTSDVTIAQGLENLARQVQSSSAEISRTSLFRFRTLHWYQPKAGAEIVPLQRGLVVLPPEKVTAAELDAAIERIAGYMVYRQLKSGLFTYQYEPATDTYSQENNLVRQVGATMALAMHARVTGESATESAAENGIRHHLQGFTPLPAVENGAFIATADRQNKLGVTALLTLAMAEHPDREQFQEKGEQLVRGMLWLQRPSGMFITAFPPAEQIDAQEFFPGEALLAMATHYSASPSAEILDAFDRAIGFYREYFRGMPSPAFVPWQVQAYSLMAQHGRRRDYVEYVFELADWLVEKQLHPGNCTWPELWGGIAAYQPGRVGISTASYLEGFADALVLAREVDDHRRARRYEQAVRDATRFVLQLQVRPEEAYFIRSPKDAVDGLRTAPALNLLRIDHAQHALIALMKARQALFPNGA